MLHDLGVGEALRSDETASEVGMDGASCADRITPVLYVPGVNLLWPDGEKTNVADDFVGKLG